MAILEEETYEKFGYYPRDLGPQSAKRILAKCDDCDKIRELYKHSYHSLCKSCAHKKENLSEKTRKRMSDTAGERKVQKGKNHPRWKGGKIKRICEICGEEFEVYPSVVKTGGGRFHSRSCNRKAQRFPTHHTKPELIFEGICKRHNLPFIYTGDSSFWIHNINPDFIECNGKKIVVEVFGDWWHSPLLNRKLGERSILTYRKRILKKYGWRLVVFWQSDLLREDAEQFVLNTLKKNGI